MREFMKSDLDMDRNELFDYFPMMLKENSNNFSSKSHKRKRKNRKKLSHKSGSATNLKRQKLDIIFKKETIDKFPRKDSNSNKSKKKLTSLNHFLCHDDTAYRHGEEFDMHDDMEFYSETHEEQDPAHQAFVKDQHRRAMKTEIEKLGKIEAISKKKLSEHLDRQTKQHLQTFQKQVSKFRAKEIANLDMKHSQLNQEVEQLKEEIIFRRQLLEEKQRRDLDTASKSKDWERISAQFRANQEKERLKFDAEDLERKKSTENKLKKLSMNLKIKRNKRILEVEKVVSKLSAQLKLQKQNQMKNDLNQHEEIFQERRKEIEKRFESLIGGENETTSNKSELAKNVPNGKHEDDKSVEVEMDSLQTPGEGSLIRRNLRQKIWVTSPFQLIVEIHNEGIYLCSQDSETKNSTKALPLDNFDNSKNNVFMAWSLKSRKFLQAIVTGQVPLGYSEIIDCLSSNPHKTPTLSNNLLPAGLIKCMMKDMRTTSERASRLRSQIAYDFRRKVKNVDMDLLQNEALKANENMKRNQSLHQKTTSDAQQCLRSFQKATRERKKAEIEMENFRNKTRNYWAQDGKLNINVSPSDKEQLLKAYSVFKYEIETYAKEENMCRQALVDSKKEVLKMHQILQLSKKKAEEAAMELEQGRIKTISGAKNDNASTNFTTEDILNILTTSIEQRRQQINDGVDIVPQSLCGRRHIIILRPTMQAIMDDIENKMEKELQAKEVKNQDEKKPIINEDVESNLKADNESDLLQHKIRAEQLMLLALYPTAPDTPLPSIPSNVGKFKSWAEPGWRVVLDPPKEKTNYILPFTSTSSVFEAALAECNSTPGRQTATLTSSKDMSHFMIPVPDNLCPIEKSEAKNTDFTKEPDPLFLPEDSVIKNNEIDCQCVNKGNASKKKPAGSKAKNEKSGSKQKASSKADNTNARDKNEWNATSKALNKEVNPSVSTSPRSKSKDQKSLRTQRKGTKQGSSAKNNEKSKKSSSPSKAKMESQQRALSPNISGPMKAHHSHQLQMHENQRIRNTDQSNAPFHQSMQNPFSSSSSPPQQPSLLQQLPQNKFLLQQQQQHQQYMLQRQQQQYQQQQQQKQQQQQQQQQQLNQLRLFQQHAQNRQSFHQPGQSNQVLHNQSMQMQQMPFIPQPTTAPSLAIPPSVQQQSSKMLQSFPSFSGNSISRSPPQSQLQRGQSFAGYPGQTQQQLSVPGPFENNSGQFLSVPMPNNNTNGPVSGHHPHMMQNSQGPSPLNNSNGMNSGSNETDPLFMLGFDDMM